MLKMPVGSANCGLQLFRTTLVVFFCGVFMLTVPHKTIAASFVVDPQKCVIDLNGEIDKFTTEDLISRYKSLNDRKCVISSVILRLHSPGGDVASAMRAGEFVRQNNMRTIVPDDASCASACVLLFLGGINRSLGYGKIGLHRPFSPNYSSSQAESKTTYENINRQVRQYLSRMNIPDGLLNIMNSVPPGEIKWLTNANMQELQITGVDPVYADQRDSEYAKRLGISKSEYYVRQQRGQTLCASESDLVQQFKCLQDVEKGLR